MTDVDADGHHCPGLPDQPLSSYCLTCFNPVYARWWSPIDHEGRCIEGRTASRDCSHAVRWRNGSLPTPEPVAADVDGNNIIPFRRRDPVCDDEGALKK